MTALIIERKTPQADENSPIPRIEQWPMTDNVKIFAGALVVTDALGNAKPGVTGLGLVARGVAQFTADNTVVGHAAGFVKVIVLTGVFGFANSSGGDAITNAARGKTVWIVDDNVVALTDGDGTRSPAGTLWDVDPLTSQVYVAVGYASLADLASTLRASGGASGGGTVGTYRARMVGTANHSLAAFVGVTGGSSTNTDGVLAVEGDIVILPCQTVATQNGPWEVGKVTAGTAPLNRPAWYAPASTQQTAGLRVMVGGEGTVFKNTEWKPMIAAASFVVDTTDGQWFPLYVTGKTALVAGAITIGAGATGAAPTFMPIFSTNSTLTLFRITANTTAATVMYAQNGNATASPTVGAISGFATVAAGTLNNADISTMGWEISNGN